MNNNNSTCERKFSLFPSNIDSITGNFHKDVESNTKYYVSTGQESRLTKDKHKHRLSITEEKFSSLMKTYGKNSKISFGEYIESLEKEKVRRVKNNIRGVNQNQIASGKSKSEKSSFKPLSFIIEEDFERLEKERFPDMVDVQLIPLHPENILVREDFNFRNNLRRIFEIKSGVANQKLALQESLVCEDSKRKGAKSDTRLPGSDGEMESVKCDISVEKNLDKKTEETPQITCRERVLLERIQELNNLVLVRDDLK